MPSAAPIRPASLVSTQQGVETSLRKALLNKSVFQYLSWLYGIILD
jgi:hypothetical protein